MEISQVGDSIKRKKELSKKTKRLIFYCLVMFFPILQFAVFYIYVNFNSILLAFRNFAPSETGYSITFSGIENFKTAFSTIKDNPMMLKNSLILFAFSMFVGLPLAIIFSYYVYKKYCMSGLFKVMLFMPQIVSSVVLTTIFRYIASDVYIALAEKLTGKTGVVGLLSETQKTEVRFATLLFYNLWVSFGANVLLFSGAMSNINNSVTESAQLDGASVVREFWSITLPMIFPTLITFIVVGMAGLFTNQMYLYLFLGGNVGELANFGWFLYYQALQSDIVAPKNMLSYSELAAMGIIFTLILAPVTLLVRKLLEKYGPSAD